MDILKRELAPIASSAWDAIDEQARRTLKTHLSARKFANIDGPHGFKCQAVNAGKLRLVKDDSTKVGYGVYEVKPLVEFRVPFELDMWELDNAERGACDINLSPLEDAAKKAAKFEEEAIFFGLSKAGITGLAEAGSPQMIEFNTSKVKDILLAVSKGTERLHGESIEGPYALIGGSKLFEALDARSDVYPVRKTLSHLVGDRIIFAPFFDDAMLVSLRGGDMKLTIGQDFSIGYDGEKQDKVKLFFTESFTFDIYEPRAVLTYKLK